jgi:L-lactate permease
MLRWQLSTPILAIIPIVLLYYGISNFWLTAFIANLIGSLIFFKVDEVIFAKELTRFQTLRKRVVRRNKRKLMRKLW